MSVYTGQGKLYLGGYDISGDTGSLSRCGGGANLLDVSPISLVGMRRIAGRYDGEFAYNVFNNPTGAHVPLSALPTTLQPIMLAIPGTAAGDFAAMLVGKHVDYAPAFGNDLSASFTVSTLASEGYPLEWGKMITAGQRTDTSATASGTGIDLGVPSGVAAVNIVSNSVANPTVVTATAHGLQTGDSVVIASHTGSTPTINGEYTVTVLTADTFTVPVNVTVGGGATGTVQRTSRRGWSAQNQVFSIAGTSVTVTVQDAHEAVAGSFANVTGGAFAAITSGAGLGAERIGSATGILKRYVRVKTTGTFSSAVFATGIYGAPG